MYEIKKGCIAFEITAKLGNMRKEQTWVIYPKSADSNEVQIQADTRIARFDLTTGKGMLSKHKSNGAYNMDLSPMMGATEFEAPAELCEAIRNDPRIVGEVAIIDLSNPEPHYTNA